MEKIITILFLIILFFLVFKSQLHTSHEKIKPIKEIKGHVKQEHVLYELLKQYSSGDKLHLSGSCNVNIYTKYIITSELKEDIYKLLNIIFESIYGVSKELFQIQELNNVYEQIDLFDNKRYIIDGTLISVNNYYTARVILDIVIIDEEVFVNFISINNASNNNIIDRYDIVFQDQGILLNHNNFTSNIRSLLDQEYLEKYKLITFESKYLDSNNHDFQNVLSLKGMLNKYLPSKLSSDSQENLKIIGLDKHYENYFPADIPVIKSPQYCKKYLNGWSNDSIPIIGDESCMFHNTSTQEEYNQPYMGPGLFFNRSSIKK